jgi:hypothetical protein
MSAIPKFLLRRIHLWDSNVKCMTTVPAKPVASTEVVAICPFDRTRSKYTTFEHYKRNTNIYQWKRVYSEKLVLLGEQSAVCSCPGGEQVTRLIQG